MSKLKTLGLGLIAVMAMAAMAAPAQAVEKGDFWAAAGATKIDATGGKSTFVFGGKELTCPAVTGNAVYKEEGPTLTGENIRYGDANHTCHVVVFGITFPITVDENSCHFTFHAGTYTPSEGVSHGSVTIENCENDSITITIWPPGSHPNPDPPECTLHIPEQTINGITYDNVTTEENKMAVEITPNNAPVTTTQTKTEGSFVCPEHLHGNATYNGSVLAKATNDDEEFVDTTVTGTEL